MFADRCEEALTFCQHVIGAKPQRVLRFKDCAEPPHLPLSDGWNHKAMHCGSRVGDTLVMACDGMAPSRPPSA